MQLNLSYKWKVDEGEIPLFRVYLGGTWYPGKESIEVKSPIDLTPLARIPRISFAEFSTYLQLMYEKGRRRIRDIPGEERIEIFSKAADILEERKDDFVEVLVKNNGKIPAAANGEVMASIERLRKTQLDVRKIYGEYVPGDWSRESLETEAVVRREPYGIVLGIIPFNYPLMDTVNKIAYSSIAGNAVVVKPPSSTPLPVLMFAQVLEEAGFPKESLSIVTLPGKEANSLVADNRISVISLTGSTETGLEVMKNAGIKQFIMELGGGDPVIVLDDADVEWAGERIATGITSYSGQRCDSIKFIFSEPGIYEELKNQIVNNLAKNKVGDPRVPGVTMGPLIDEKTAIEFENAINDAKAKGARVLYGGTRDRNYIQPTLIEADNLEQLYLYQKEVFASIAVIVKVANLDKAIELSNKRRYGLDAAIFGKDINKIRRLIRLLEVGAIYINDFPRHGIGYFPFGGRRDSGTGREGIGYTVELVTAYKSIVYNYKGRGVWEYT